MESRKRRGFLCGIVGVGAAFAVIALWSGETAGQQASAPGLAGAQLIEDLVLANRILANEDIVDGLGHVSARSDRNPERFLLSRGIAPAVVTADDLMEYDLEGKPIDARGRSMYGERYIHAAIFKARPDVKAIVHCHTPSVLPFANSDVVMRPMYQMSNFLVLGAPVWDIRSVPDAKGMLVSNLGLGQSLAHALGDKAVVLMRGHGLVTVGASIPEAVGRAIHMDLNAKMQSQAIALGGKITYLSAAEATDPAPFERHWQHWLQRLKARGLQ